MIKRLYATLVLFFIKPALEQNQFKRKIVLEIESSKQISNVLSEPQDFLKNIEQRKKNLKRIIYQRDYFVGMPFSERVKTLRDYYGLSVPELAKLANITAASIYKYEHRHNKVNQILYTKNILALSKALGVNISFLLGETDVI